MGLFTKNHTKKAAISPLEAYQRMSAPDQLVLLDVRTPPEYKQVRINGAKLIPVDELAQRAPTELPDKSIPVLIYCHSGARAAKAANLLAGMGYADAVSFGGIINWPYETARG